MTKIKKDKELRGLMEFPITEVTCNYCKASLYHILWDGIRRMNGSVNEDLIIDRLDIAHFCSVVCEEESKELYG
jgi:hypothetical protein